MSERPEAPPIVQASHAGNTRGNGAEPEECGLAGLPVPRCACSTSQSAKCSGRAAVFMGLLCGVPVIIALVLRGLRELGASPINVNNVAVNGPADLRHHRVAPVHPVHRSHPRRVLRHRACCR